ncbi:MAG: hypothetical protein ACXWL5_04460 [Candidatus Chromulinivorax sp.]
MKKNILKMTLLIIFTIKTNLIESKVNEFGISDIIPSNKKSSKQYHQQILDRITEEMGSKSELTIDKILEFLTKIKNYFESLLNTNTNNTHNMQIARLALEDVQKAKKMLKITKVTADKEQQLRHDLKTLEAHINSYR